MNMVVFFCVYFYSVRRGYLLQQSLYLVGKEILKFYYFMQL